MSRSTAAALWPCLLSGFVSWSLSIMLIASVQHPSWAQTCVGDCDGSGNVTVDELVAAINIALGTSVLESCTASDGDGDGQVTVNDIISSISNALTGCPTLVLSYGGVCTADLLPCTEGTQIEIRRCDGDGECSDECLDGAGTLLETTIVSGGGGMFAAELDVAEVGDACIVFSAKPEKQQIRVIDFGCVAQSCVPASSRGGIAGTSLDRTVSLDPASEATVRLLEEFRTPDTDELEILALNETVRRETSELSTVLAAEQITTPIGVTTAYTSQAEASVPVREILGLPRDDFLAVRFTRDEGCIETGQEEAFVFPHTGAHNTFASPAVDRSSVMNVARLLDAAAKRA